MTKILFKDDSKNKAEFYSGRLDNRIYAIFFLCIGYLEYNHPELNVKVVEVYRSQREQDEIYGHKIEYKSKPWRSVHQDWRGLDFIIEYESGENDNNAMQELSDYINCAIAHSNTNEYSTAVYHTVQGEGAEHIHLQVSNKNETRILK